MSIGSVIAGCLPLGDGEPTATTETVTATATATATATETVTETAEPEPAEEESAAQADAEADEADPTGDAEVDDSPSTNERGNFEMPDESPVTLTETDTGTQVAEWSAGDVESDVTCTASYAREAEYGQYVSIEFELTVEAEFRDHDPDGLMMNPLRFALYDDDYNLSSTDPATYSCLDDADKIPLETRPGASSSGKMVFDVEFDSGYLVFHDYLTGDYYEWSY